MLVLFDFDGTLVDSSQHILVAMARAFSDHELPCPDGKSILATVGLQPEDMLAVFAPDLPDDKRTLIARSYRDYSPVLRKAEPDLELPFPEARETLAGLKADGHPLGIVTGKRAISLNHCLERFGWRPFFDDLRPSDNAPGKPDPTLILRAMSAMEATPAETVMVGDTSFDMIMAKRAGVTAIGVEWGHHDREFLQQQGADYVVESFAALRNVLASHAAAGPSD